MGNLRRSRSHQCYKRAFNWNSTQPPCRFPTFHCHPSLAQLPEIRKLLPNLLSRSIIRKICIPQLLFFSRIFLVPKKDNSDRLIIDLSFLNKFLITPTFKMETIEKIAPCISVPMWGCTLDLQDAYFHVPINWFFQIFLAFMVDLQIYVFQFLPFGLSVAPWTFSRVIKPIKAHIHILTIRFHTYLDDFLILSLTPGSLVEHLSYILSLLETLGFQINRQKSQLVPSQTIEYLGVNLHLDSLLLSLPHSKVLGITTLCQETLLQSHASRHHLESLVGVLNFASSLVPLGRLRLRPIITWMNSHTSTETRDLLVPLDQSLKELLVIWTDQTFLTSPVHMTLPIPSLQLMTDSSKKGWSGILLPHKTSGEWPKSFRYLPSNWLELNAIFQSVKHFLPLLKGQSVQILSDNMTAVACIQHQGTLGSKALMDLSQSLLEFCLLYNILLIPKHISGILNVLADQGSRQVPISTEWKLDYQTFLWLIELVGLMAVDLFATLENHQIPSYVSPCPDPNAVDINALSLQWNRWNSIYLFPPTALLPKVSSLLLKFQGRGVLVAPFHAQSSWLPNLLRRSPNPIPLREGYSLSQNTTKGTVFHPNPSVFCLHAWIL